MLAPQSVVFQTTPLDENYIRQLQKSVAEIQLKKMGTNRHAINFLKRTIKNTLSQENSHTHSRSTHQNLSRTSTNTPLYIKQNFLKYPVLGI